MWRYRGVTLLEKIQIVNTFVVPKFRGRAALTVISRISLCMEINKLIYGFI